MPRRRPQAIPDATPIRSCERWTTNVSWPAPIDQRLAALVDLAVEEGEPDTLTRSELLAAMVFTAPNDGAALSTMLRKFRKAKAKDAKVGDDSGGTNVLVLRERRPGRR